MTPDDGFPSGMDRFALDAGTAEGLVSGAVDVGDAPPEYRAVAVALHALREPPESWELVGGPAVAERIAATVVAARTDHRAKGFFVFKGGWEYVGLVALVAVCVAALGPGEWSIDAAVHWHLFGLGWAGVALAAGLLSAVALLLVGRARSAEAVDG